MKNMIVLSSVPSWMDALVISGAMVVILGLVMFLISYIWIQKPSWSIGSLLFVYIGFGLCLGGELTECSYSYDHFDYNISSIDRENTDPTAFAIGIGSDSNDVSSYFVYRQLSPNAYKIETLPTERTNIMMDEISPCVWEFKESYGKSGYTLHIPAQTTIVSYVKGERIL